MESYKKDSKPTIGGLATRSEVAEFLKVKHKTLDRWALEARGPRFRKFGNANARCSPVRYVWEDVFAWVQSQATGGGGVK